MSARQLNVRYWELTITAWRVAVLSARVVSGAEPSARFGTNDGNMVGIVAMTLYTGTDEAREPRRIKRQGSYLEWTEMSTFQQHVTLLHTTTCEHHEPLYRERESMMTHTVWRDPGKLAWGRDIFYPLVMSMTGHGQGRTQSVLRVEFLENGTPHPASRRQVLGVSKDVKTFASSGQGHCRKVSE